MSCKESAKKTEALVEEAPVVEKEVVNETSDLKVYNFTEMEPLLHKTGDKVYVVNFWATWCAPCVKELPYFEKVTEDYANKDVEVLLVSLDFSKQYETKLIPFIKTHQLKSEVVALNDPDSNAWIPKVDPDWSGSIPATIIYKGSTRKFFEKSFTYEELQTEINQFLN